MNESQPIDYFLASVACLIRTNGWVSRGAAFEDKSITPTSDIAWHTKQNITDADKKTAKDALAWIRGWKGAATDEYMVKLQADCISDQVAADKRGMVASLIKAFENQTTDFSSSQYVGEIDEEISSKVKLLKISETKFGFAFRAVDSAGNLFSFFEKTDNAFGKVGDVFKIKGKVRKHDDFKNIKSTVLSYAKVEK